MIERTVWMYWQQGEEHAPALVQLCVASWRLRNPEWRVVVLDEHSMVEAANVRAVTSLDRADLTVQKISDLARVCLLREHGGVWADATVFCRTPLDEWLPECAASDFFAFANPGVDRLMASWFLAAERDHVLLRELHRAYTRLWRNDVYWNQNTRAAAWLLRTLEPVLSRNTARTRLWLTWPVRKLLGIHPYYQFHYTFNAIVARDARCRGAWAAVPQRSADLPHRMLTYADRADAIDAATADIASGASPVYKLNWRLDTTTPYWAAVLHALRATLAESDEVNARTAS